MRYGPISHVSPFSGYQADLGPRVAVHETGHALVAWMSPFHTVESVVARGENGGSGWTATRLDCAPHNASSMRWWSLAVSLGGLSGELENTGRFSSGNSHKDLTKAIRTIQEIVQLNGWLPPWSVLPNHDGFDITRTLRDGALSPIGIHILKQGYAKARSTMVEEQDRFSRLAGHLTRYASIEGDGLQKLLR